MFLSITNNLKSPFNPNPYFVPLCLCAFVSFCAFLSFCAFVPSFAEAAPKDLPEKELFELSSKLFTEEKDKAEAINSFNIFLERFSNSKRADRAQFMIGECLFENNKKVLMFQGLKKNMFSPAIGAYQKLIDKYPKHPLLPTANLFLGNCFYYQKNYDQAVACYQEILNQSYQKDLHEMALYLINRAYYEQGNYAQIITGYHYVLNNFPPNVSKWRALAYLYIGEAYYQHRFYSEAKPIYELIIKNYPLTRAAYYAKDGLVWYHLQKGEYDAANKLLQQIASLEPTKPKGEKGEKTEKTENTELSISRQYEIGNGLFNQQKYEQALEIYKNLIKTYPQHKLMPDALYQSGLCYYRLEYYSQAIDAWKKLIEIYPTHSMAVEAIYKIADTYFRSQDYEKSIINYQRIIDEYPQSPGIKEAYLRIGQCYYNQENDDKAIECFQNIINKYPDDPKSSDALEAIETVLYRKEKNLLNKQGTGQDAEKKINQIIIEMLKGFLLKYPQSKLAPEIQFHLAKKYYAIESYQMALVELQKMSTLYADSKFVAEAQYYIGETYYEMENYEEAITNYQRLCSDFPDTEFVAPALFNAGLCYKKTSKLSEAAAVYAKFIEQYPKDKMVNDALLELVAIYKDQFRYNLAIPAINNLLTRLDPSDESRLEIIYSLSECYTEMDDEKSAIDQYLKLRDMTPANNIYRLRALAKLGEMYENKKDWAKAIDIYKDIAQNTDREDWRTAVKERIGVDPNGNCPL